MEGIQGNSDASLGLLIDQVVETGPDGKRIVVHKAMGVRATRKKLPADYFNEPPKE